MKINLQKNITDYLQKHNIIQNYPSSEYGVICEDENDIAAYLYYSENHYHPSAVYLRFAILDKDIKSETLIEMHDKFKTVLPSSNIILQLHRNFSFYEDFISANDFREFKKTYEPEVPIQNMLSRFKSCKDKGQYSRKKFIMTDDLLDITKKVYESTHDINPLKEMGLPEWSDLITDDLDFDNSIVLYDQHDEIIAHMLIYENEETSKDVGCCYYKNQEAKNLLSSALYNILFQLQEENFTHINLEVDSTDEYLYEFFADFIKHQEPSLISYIKQ